jgi:hypothetical protein
MGLGSGIRDPGSGKNLIQSPDPGYRGQIGRGSRIRICNTVLTNPSLNFCCKIFARLSLGRSFCLVIKAGTGSACIDCVYSSIRSTGWDMAVFSLKLGYVVSASVRYDTLKFHCYTGTQCCGAGSSRVRNF